jgi:hypothetical protein
VILFGIVLSIMVSPLTTTVMTSVEERSSGIASAINNVVSRIGGLVVIALLGLLGAEHVFKFSMVLRGFGHSCWNNFIFDYKKPKKTSCEIRALVV